MRADFVFTQRKNPGSKGGTISGEKFREVSDLVVGGHTFKVRIKQVDDVRFDDDTRFQGMVTALPREKVASSLRYPGAAAYASTIDMRLSSPESDCCIDIQFTINPHTSGRWDHYEVVITSPSGRLTVSKGREVEKGFTVTSDSRPRTVAENIAFTDQASEVLDGVEVILAAITEEAKTGRAFQISDHARYEPALRRLAKHLRLPLSAAERRDKFVTNITFTVMLMIAAALAIGPAALGISNGCNIAPRDDAKEQVDR